MVKFPTNGQPQVFRALIAGTSPVAVERPETIQYFNNMVRRRRVPVRRRRVPVRRRHVPVRRRNMVRRRCAVSGIRV